jgi:hypothetical protein
LIGYVGHQVLHWGLDLPIGKSSEECPRDHGKGYSNADCRWSTRWLFPCVRRIEPLSNADAGAGQAGIAEDTSLGEIDARTATPY